MTVLFPVRRTPSEPREGLLKRLDPFFTISAVALLGCGDELGVAGPRAEDHEVLLWVSTSPDPPPCPGGRLDYWDGWADVAANPDDVECGTCACGPAACVLPSNVIAHRTAGCADEGTSVTINTVANRQGTCIKAEPLIPDNDLASVTLDPPTVAPRCEPLEQFTPPPITGRFARACPVNHEHQYDASFNALTCIAPEGDGSCRPGFHIRYEFQERLGDARTCTPCECGAPIGGNCAADVLLFRDTECSDLMTLHNGIMTHALCIDTQPSSPLASVRMVLAREEPGSCSPKTKISRVEGKIEIGETRVFCCTEERFVDY